MKTGWIVAAVAILVCGSAARAQSPRENLSSESPTAGRTVELSDFVLAVVDANPQVNAARAALDSSAAMEGAARRPIYNPQLAFQAEDADTEVRALGISQTVDWADKRGARTSVAAAERRAAEADYLMIRRQVTAELLTALSAHQTESDRSALAGIRASTMQDFSELARQRLEVGDIGQIERDLATLAFADARMRKATALAGVAEAEQAVSSLAVGTASSEWPGLATELPIAPGPDSRASVSVTSLPEVRAAQARVIAAAARVDLRRRERRPDPTLSLRGGTENDETLIGLNVTIPLPVRNRFNYEVTAASAAHRQALQEAAVISRQAYARFEGARTRYQLAHAAWQDWQQTGDVSLQRQSDLLWRLWEAGELSTTEFLVQLQQTLDTRESALELRASLWRAWLEWLMASGEIESWLGTDGRYASGDAQPPNTEEGPK